MPGKKPKLMHMCVLLKPKLNCIGAKDTGQYKMQTADRVQNVDLVQNADREFKKLFFRRICGNMSSYNMPSVTQSLVRDYLSRALGLLWNIPHPFLDMFFLFFFYFNIAAIAFCFLTKRPQSTIVRNGSSNLHRVFLTSHTGCQY